MQKFLIAFWTFAALSQLSHSLASDSDIKYFVASPKSLDYKFTGKKDEHRFGVELKENKQFHHTKTAEDGVRLGCYGHELEGKKYSTHYVADGRGYRLVPHQGLITVYPKDGGEARKASFVQSFNEDEIRSANIRYFFPDGCQSPQIEFGTLDLKAFLPDRKPKAVVPSIQVKDEKPIELPKKKIPEVRKPKELDLEVIEPEQKIEVEPLQPPKVQSYTPRIEPLTVLPLVEPITVKPRVAEPITVQPRVVEPLKPAIVTVKPKAVEPITVKPKLTEEIIEEPKSIDPVTPAPKIAAPVTVSTNPRIDIPKKVPHIPFTPYKTLDSKCSDTCCDDNRPQILMSRTSPGSCCKGVSKIVIPLDMETLGRIATSEIIEITNETNNVEMLKKLLKLVEKYKF